MFVSALYNEGLPMECFYVQKHADIRFITIPGKDEFLIPLNLDQNEYRKLLDRFF